MIYSLIYLLLILPADQLVLKGYSKTKHGYVLVSKYGREKVQRFEVRSGDCRSLSVDWNDCKTDRERSEVKVDTKWSYGTDIWIGFSVYLPKNFKTSEKVNTVVGQIHQRDGPRGLAGGYKSFPPVMQLIMKGDRYFLQVHILSGSFINVRNLTKDFQLASLDRMKGKWTEIIIHFDTSKEQEILEVFVNDSKKAVIKNWITFRSKSYFFKYGIYRAFVSRHVDPMPTQVLFIDEVKVYNKSNKVITHKSRL